MTSPFPKNYYPELDVTDELEEEPAKFYQSIVSSLCWLVKMGRIDVTDECSELSLFLANPRYDHFIASLHVFAYLKTSIWPDLFWIHQTVHLKEILNHN